MVIFEEFDEIKDLGVVYSGFGNVYSEFCEF